ncbi:helix-turn-helix transcriptional regulator [Streptomyces sp. MMCC 100]|uniref:helix-turn-helix transcriptional regulator n=1 Tax=Streptomyces sp. MMCC 100 TaxID=3163555 RepID=UPI003598311A
MRKTSARLLSLLSLLQARRDWPGRVLAERLDISPRTLRRDVDRLRELGYPVLAAKGPDGGYRLDAKTRLPPLLFDDEQAVALAVALRTATGAGIEDGAARALATLRQVMPGRLSHRIDALHVTSVERSAPGPRPQADTGVLMALGAAVRAGEVLRFDHAPAHPASTAADAVPSPRRVEPHHLVTRGGRWYLVAWDLDREDWRVFRADRITPRTPTGPRFTSRELPGKDVAAFVTGRFRGSDGSYRWPCRGQAVLHAPASAVSPHAADGVVEELGPDRCRLTLGSWSWPALAAAFCLFDTDVEVVGPPALREAFVRLADRCARAAAEPTPP